MLEIKYAAKPFGAMESVELLKTAWATLSVLNIITGWRIPDDEQIQDELVKQFALKMEESYSNVNAQEIQYAFRNNTDVKDWGKAMNLNLIDEVMRPYLNKRLEISQIEEQQKVKALPAPPAPEITDEDFIEAIYNTYKLTCRMQTIPELAYKILEPVLNLSREAKDEILSKVAAGCEPDVSQDARKLLCKQFAVANYFDNTYKK